MCLSPLLAQEVRNILLDHWQAVNTVRRVASLGSSSTLPSACRSFHHYSVESPYQLPSPVRLGFKRSQLHLLHLSTSSLTDTLFERNQVFCPLLSTSSGIGHTHLSRVIESPCSQARLDPSSQVQLSHVVLVPASLPARWRTDQQHHSVHIHPLSPCYGSHSWLAVAGNTSCVCACLDACSCLPHQCDILLPLDAVMLKLKLTKYILTK
jgi:hypothetical protein